MVREPLWALSLQVGERVEARVLAVEPEAKRVTLTLRKSLLSAMKAPPLASLAQAQPGARFSGLVTGELTRPCGWHEGCRGALLCLLAQPRHGPKMGVLSSPCGLHCFRSQASTSAWVCS
jgi:hypothetical protein